MKNSKLVGGTISSSRRRGGTYSVKLLILTLLLKFTAVSAFLPVRFLENWVSSVM